jgi:hypothetical protein
VSQWLQPLRQLLFSVRKEAEKAPLSLKGAVVNEKKGLKETLDLLDAIDALVVVLDVANDDGKISIADLPKFAPLAVKFYDACMGIRDIPEELKDLDAEECQMIAQRSVDIMITTIRLVMGDRVPT